MDSFEFNKEDALNSDILRVDTSGVYEVTIESAFTKKTKNGAKYIEFNFDSERGKIRYVNVYYRNIDGSVNHGSHQIQALMGLLRIDRTTINSTSDGDAIPEFVDKRIKVAIQKTEYYKKDNSLAYNFKLLHFFSVKTSQTYSEAIENKEPEIYLLPIRDLQAKKRVGNNNVVSIQQNYDDDLPF